MVWKARRKKWNIAGTASKTKVNAIDTNCLAFINNILCFCMCMSIKFPRSYMERSGVVQAGRDTNITCVQGASCKCSGRSL